MLRPKHYVVTVLLSQALACFLLAQVTPRETEAKWASTPRLTPHCRANDSVPDPKCTPGAVLTTDTTKICEYGYTKTIRDVPLPLKKEVFEEYGIPWSLHSKYEVDHLISLELGGSNDPTNLWPESSTLPNGSKTKDKFENYLHAVVCTGKVPIQEAQRQIASNWLAYYDESLTARSAEERDSKTLTGQSNVKHASPKKTILEPAVKKSSGGICHPKGSAYYARTIHFTPYNSLNECLLSGGRRSVR